MKIIVILSMLVLSGVAGVASADHSWQGYHWAVAAPTVANKSTSSLYNVQVAVSEWQSLATPIQPVLVSGAKGQITVSEASSMQWLGLARVYLEGGHIVKGEVKLNTRLLQSYGASAADHVLCQELGHVLGLDHNRVELDTCMNDQAVLGSATTPNAHDVAELNLIYDHQHEPPVGGGKPAGRWVTVHVFPVP